MLKLVFLLAAVAFLSEVTGFLTHQLNLAFGILFLICFTVNFFPSRPEWGKSLGFWVALIALPVALVSLRMQPFARPIVVSLYMFCVWRVLPETKRGSFPLNGVALGIFGFGLLLLSEKYSPIIWSLVQSLSLGYSSLVGLPLVGGLHLGASMSGLPVAFLLVAVSIPFCLSLERKKSVWILLSATSFLAANGLAMLLSHPLANWLQKTISNSPESVSVYERALLSTPLLTLVLGVLPLYALVRMAGAERASIRRDGKPVLGWVGIGSLFLGILAIGFTIPSSGARSGAIGFYEHGYANWLRPTPGDYGSRSAGMFGNLPVLAEALGFESTMLDSIDAQALEELDALFMVNVDHELPAYSYKAIAEFVRNGGALLLLGDHTFVKDDGKNWLNVLLEPYRIRYNFDSADYIIGGWLHSYFFPASPLTAGLRDEQNDVGSVVGASLDISYPAVPVVVGRYGFSDAGSPAGGDVGYLGNLDYEPGERLGDMVLAAAQNYGKGKVLVFGDTSGFVNPLLTDTYVFVRRVLIWLVGEEKMPAHGMRLFVSLVLVSAFLLFTLLSGVSWPRLFLLPVAVIAALLACQGQLARTWDMELGGDFALIDDSHYGRYPLEFWKMEGLMGLHLNLMRNGYLSFNLGEFQPRVLLRSRLFFVVAPTKKFTRMETDVLDEYVKQGGNLFLSVGYEEKGASLPLLRRFGFDIENIPLGAFLTDVPGATVSVYFREAWPVSSSGGGYTVIAGHGHHPTAVWKQHGAGKVFVFGDSGFFSNINLETEDEPLMPNIQFLNWMLARLVPRPEGI